jgi:hypothetical protein
MFRAHPYLDQAAREALQYSDMRERSRDQGWAKLRGGLARAYITRGQQVLVNSNGV